MMYMSQTQWLFWGGIGVMGGAVFLALVCLTVFSVTGRRLKKKLEQEYGKPQI